MKLILAGLSLNKILNAIFGVKQAKSKLGFFLFFSISILFTNILKELKLSSSPLMYIPIFNKVANFLKLPYLTFFNLLIKGES